MKGKTIAKTLYTLNC